MNEKLNWLLLADKFAADGEPQNMRGCAQELFALDQSDPDGPAVMAEAAFYTGAHEDAAVLLNEILAKHPDNLRARLVAAMLAGAKFRLDEEIPALKSIIADTENVMTAISMRRELKRHFLNLGNNQPVEEHRQEREEDNIRKKLFARILLRANGYLADAAYLAGEPDVAAKALAAASDCAEDNNLSAELYSKHLFMLNYRSISPRKMLAAAEKYQDFYKDATTYKHHDVKLLPERRLRLGYLSPDFREHSVAQFLTPLLRDYDRKNFVVYCYSTGRTDDVTARFKRLPVNWRDLRGRTPRTAARMINEDRIDILVELAGHSQNSVLPIMALKPAPLAVSAIGYMSTTGLSAVDYFLSDNICMPINEGNTGFAEKVLRLPHSHLCYSPGMVRAIPAAGVEPPSVTNGYITFGCFNNFAKVTDAALHLWRGIMERVPDSKLVIKSKICSIPAGRQLVNKRLLGLSFNLSRVELRPYSPDYLEQYHDIDIALDTMPYNGGLTTCEALYMGVPVVVIRGHSHGTRFGASILEAAGLPELIADSEMEYIKKAVQLATSATALRGFHAGLRANLQRSPLMDAKAYIAGLEAAYRKIWADYCQQQEK